MKDLYDVYQKVAIMNETNNLSLQLGEYSELYCHCRRLPTEHFP